MVRPSRNPRAPYLFRSELADRAAAGLQDLEAGPDGSYLCVSLEHTRQAAAWCDHLETHAHRIYSDLSWQIAQRLVFKISRPALMAPICASLWSTPGRQRHGATISKPTRTVSIQI